MNDSRPAISRQDVCSFSVARTPIAAVAPLSPFLDSEGVRATTRLPISNPKNGLLGFSSYPPTARMLKTESLEQVHLGKTPNEAVFERSHSLETSPSSRRLSATKANSVDFLLGKTSAQQSGGKISVIQHTNSLSRGGSLEAIDTVHVQKADLEKGGPPAHNQESSQENDVGCSIYSKETTAESGVCCQDGDNSNVDEKCRTELTPKGKFLGMAEFQRGIKENDVSDAKTRLFVPAKVDMSAQTALSKSPPQTCVRDASLTVTEQHAVITSQTSSKETVSQTSSSHISKRNSPHKRQLLRQLSVSDEFELHDSASLRTMTDGTLPSKNVATTASNVQSRDVWMSDSQNQQASMRCSTSWSTVAISSAVTIPLPFENPLFMPKYMIQLHNGSGIQVPDACSSSSMPAVTLPTSLPPQNDATNSNAVSAPINLTMSYHSQHGDQKIGLEESIPSVSTAAFSILQMAAAATPNAPLPGIQSSIRDLSSSNFTGDHNINPALYPITDPVSEAFPDHTDTKYPPGSSPTKTTSSDVFVPLKPQSVTFHELTNQPQPLCTVFQTPQTLPLTGEKDCLPTLQNFGQTQTPSGTLSGNEVSFSSSSSSIFSSSSSTSSLTSSSLNCTAALTSNSTPASCTNSSSSVYSYKTSTSNSPTLVSAAKKRRLSYKKYGKKAEKHVIEKRTPKLSTRGKKVNVTEVTEKIESTEIIENDEARPVTMAPKLAQGAETRQHEGNENDSGPASSSSVSTPSRATEIADGNSTHKETLLFDGEETCGENVSLPKCKLVQQCELETTQLSAGSGAAPETSCQSGARPTGHRALSSRGCRRPQTCETQARKPCEEMKIKIEESNEGSGMDEMNEPSLLDEDEENALQTDTELVDEDIDQHFKKSVTTLQDIEGGYMSTEQYVYVRGRGRGRFVCQECGIRCHKPSMLRKHIRSHTDLRPYQCIPCSFSFKTKGNLTKHERSRAHYKQCLMKAGVDADAQEQDQSSDNGMQLVVL
uniref:C2H2-type domain-containing protein n=1 Tax=Eptatretus burgeri TaxID=7764 RepID=A0A8C4QZS3_EPTBU